MLLTIAALLFFSLNSNAQKANKYHKEADKLYNKGLYEKAAYKYLQALAVDPNNDNIIAAFIPPGHKHSPKKADENPAYLTYQLAESFRQLKDYINAQKMYEQFFAFKMDNFYPMARFWYAQCLKANNQPEAAEKQFTTFLAVHKENDKYSEDAKTLAIECRDLTATNKQNPDQIIITKMPWPINGNDNSFAFQRMDDSTFIFSGIRPEAGEKKTKFPIRIYSGKLNQPPAVEKISMKGEPMDMAAASISPDRLTIYFTAWKTKIKNTIFMATRKSVNDSWDIPVEMDRPVNEKKYSSKHPFITGDGKYLLFSSDRPGGKGGFDIWYVQLKDGKIIGDAKNAGSLINTRFEEVSPFYDTAQNVLYFASDRKGGIGGMDIYSSKGALETNAWDDPVCLPYPINSAKDETHYRRYGNTDTAYLSSNRDYEMNLEIFSVVNFKRPPYQGILVQTTDKKEEQPATAQPNKNNNPTVVQVIPVAPDKSVLESTIDSMNQTVEHRYNTHFDFNSSKIRDEDRSVLDNVISMLSSDPSLNVVAASFTDCKGTLNANKRVARRRARAIRRYLVRNGIDPSRIIVDYHAAEHYVTPCKDDNTYNVDKQIVNRRSDILLTKEEEPKWLPSGKEIDADKIVESLKENNSREKTSRRSERRARRLSAAAAKERMTKSKKASGLNSTNKKNKSSREKVADNNYNNGNTSWNEGKVWSLSDMLQRPMKPAIEVYTLSDSVTVDFYDNGVVDNDSVSIIYNNRLLVRKEMLQASTPIHLTLKISANQQENSLIVFADNLGKEPPNSALVVITDSKGKRTEVSVFSDLEHNAVIRFIKGVKK